MEQRKLNEEIKLYGEGKRYIEFLLNGKKYATPLLFIKEVLTLPELTPIPKSPAHFKGLMNLRGHVISVADLKVKMNIPPNEVSTKNDEIQDEIEMVDHQVVMVLGYKDITMGIIVDHVTRVLNISDLEIADSDNIQSKSNLNYLNGIYQVDGHVTTLIDIIKILDL
jgi:purine-binding chemotaxis protein CheW